MRVLAAMSGGVDSAVAAAVMKSRGHEVTGVTMSIWRDGKYRGGGKDACFGPGEREDAAAAGETCRILGIRHLVLDCADAYEKMVLDDFRREYRAGRTPNPCVRCNSLIKFGALPELAKRAGIEFSLFATGHYARLENGGGRTRMLVARDGDKDQSYFLHRLRQDQLANLATPLGDFAKREVREMARELSLPVHDRPDSQDFYSGDHRELLGLEDEAGNIVEASGRILGRHRGCWNFTIGQRRGLGLSCPDPLYVVDIKPSRNEVVVGDRGMTLRRGLRAADVNWLSIPPPRSDFTAAARIRSSARTIPARVFPEGNEAFRLEFAEPAPAVAPGQSAVVYDGDLLLGGGVIVSAE